MQEIEAQITSAKAATAKQNVGVVREIGDGVAKIEGLTDAMLNEMLDFGDGIMGLALNLEETEVGAVILGILPEISRPIMEYRILIYGILLLGMMRFQPGGLLGSESVLSKAFRRTIYRPVSPE